MQEQGQEQGQDQGQGQGQGQELSKVASFEFVLFHSLVQCAAAYS